MADMPEKMSICRAKGIAFSGILLQSEAQLKRMYGEFGATEIIDDCDHYVFMGGNNYETAKTLSLKLNVPLDEILFLPSCGTYHRISPGTETCIFYKI